MAEQHAPTRPRSPTPSPVSKPKARPWYASLRSNTAAAVIIFVVTPLILIGIGAPMVVPGYRVLAFRSFLDLTLCLLPATMWYLFIITRRASLLNDFVTSLNRLGLLQPMEYEDGDGPARQRRVDAYLQKFEASYGPLSKDVRRSILDGTFNPGAPEERSTRASGRPADVIAASTTPWGGWSPCHPTAAPSRWRSSSSPSPTPSSAPTSSPCRCCSAATYARTSAAARMSPWPCGSSWPSSAPASPRRPSSSSTRPSATARCWSSASPSASSPKWPGRYSRPPSARSPAWSSRASAPTPPSAPSTASPSGTKPAWKRKTSRTSPTWPPPTSSSSSSTPASPQPHHRLGRPGHPLHPPQPSRGREGPRHQAARGGPPTAAAQPRGPDGDVAGRAAGSGSGHPAGPGVQKARSRLAGPGAGSHQVERQHRVGPPLALPHRLQPQRRQREQAGAAGERPPAADGDHGSVITLPHDCRVRAPSRRAPGSR
jgi:hypothetical protein